MRPTKRVDEELHAKWPKIFQIGDPVAYTRNPEDWLPEFSLDVMPIPVPPTDKEFKANMPTTKKKKAPTTITPTPEISDELTAQFEQVISLMHQIGLSGNKKLAAAMVKAAIYERVVSKSVRDDLDKSNQEG